MHHGRCALLNGTAHSLVSLSSSTRTFPPSSTTLLDPLFHSGLVHRCPDTVSFSRSLWKSNFHPVYLFSSSHFFVFPTSYPYSLTVRARLHELAYSRYHWLGHNRCETTAISNMSGKSAVFAWLRFFFPGSVLRASNDTRLVSLTPFNLLKQTEKPNRSCSHFQSWPSNFLQFDLPNCALDCN